MDVEKWLKVEGASQASINELQDIAGFELPSTYVDLLRFSNGGEGPMPLYGQFCLDRAEDAGNPKQIGLYPGRFVFGGNGGLELFAFDLTGNAPWRVLAFDGVDPDGSVRMVADDFAAFLQLIGS
ncbi:SMI1/KNR4 family protein [Paraburkholderia acidicola]|uniref:SMI1/KNR4 family protein n=1 Tax=Paraburkholderia acidicola TaxID=1912599 RepID=A0ABV1LF74_9BURK